MSDEEPTIMVVLANPRTESTLITLAGALAQHEGGRVLATHIVTVPDQTPLADAAENKDRIGDSSKDLLATAKSDAEAFDVPIETETILSHHGFEGLFDAIEASGAETVVMGYEGTQFAGGRSDETLDEQTHRLPCDFLVLDGQDVEISDVLVPTDGSPSSDLSAEIACALQESVGVDISLLHVVDSGEEAEGREFLHEWADQHHLSDAEKRVETGDAETVIGRLGNDYSLAIIGATEQGLLSRIVRGSLTFDTIHSLDTPVLLTERPGSRSLWKRLFGRR